MHIFLTWPIIMWYDIFYIFKDRRDELRRRREDNRRQTMTARNRPRQVAIPYRREIYRNNEMAARQATINPGWVAFELDTLRRQIGLDPVPPETKEEEFNTRTSKEYSGFAAWSKSVTKTKT